MLNNLSSKLLTLVVAAALFTLLATSPAAARIECRGNFSDHEIRPDIDAVLRGKADRVRCAVIGIRVTDSQVRNNPNTKVWLCQMIGNDNRLKGSCGAYSERAYPW